MGNTNIYPLPVIQWSGLDPPKPGAESSHARKALSRIVAMLAPV